MLSDRTGNDPYKDMLDIIMRMAKVIGVISFGRKIGEQWEHATFGYEIDGKWNFLDPWTDNNPTQVRQLKEIGKIQDLIVAGRVTRVIGIHGHQVFPVTTKEGDKVWHYDQDFSDIISTGGKSGGDMEANMKSFELLKKFGVKYYAVVVLADGRVRLHDPETGYKNTIGMTDPDPNMKYRETGAQQKTCIVM